jgi:hypothetical protein
VRSAGLNNVFRNMYRMSSTPGYLPPCFSSSTSLSDRVSSTRVRVGVVDAFRWPPLLAGSDTRRYRGWRVLCSTPSLLLCVLATFVDDDGSCLWVRRKTDKTDLSSPGRPSRNQANPIRYYTRTSQVRFDTYWLSCSVLFRCWAHGDCGRVSG